MQWQYHYILPLLAGQLMMNSQKHPTVRKSTLTVAPPSGISRDKVAMFWDIWRKTTDGLANVGVFIISLYIINSFGKLQ
jgi:hypothetical protein